MSDALPSRAGPLRRILAWGVHLLTASGAVFGAIALLAIGAGNFTLAAVWMMVCFVVDSVDGTLARAVRVREVLPDVDGRRLDDMVDYLNYVIVPVVFMVGAGLLPYWCVAPPVLASAYGFSQAKAKTDDDFFLGWPSFWNVLAFYLWLLELSPTHGVAWTLGLSVAIFVPVKYLYPSRIPNPLLRNAVSWGGLPWSLLMVGLFLSPPSDARWWIAFASLAYPALYVGLSVWLGNWKQGFR